VSLASAPALSDNTTNTANITTAEAAPENSSEPQRAPQAADEPGRGITAPETGAVKGVRTKEKPAERCIPEFPGGKGCYLCDSNHPQRKMEGASGEWHHLPAKGNARWDVAEEDRRWIRGGVA
jgi:hypothetical protein